MTLLVFYISLALGVSFLCSVLEAVLLSLSPAYVAGLHGRRPKVAARLQALKAHIDEPLAAILSLNTVAHTMGAAGAGAQAQVVFGEAWISVISAVLTLLILVVSEIIPKTLGAVYWKQIAPWVAFVMPGLITVTYPLVLLSQGISRSLGARHHGPTLDREEFSALALRLGDEGVLGAQESSVLANLLRFRALEARDIMTPRTVMVSFPENATVGELIQEEEKLCFSRIPVWSESLDDVTGLVLKHDLLLALARGQEETHLAELRRDILVLSEHLKVPELLNRMLRAQDHLVLLVDDFGGTAGIVTLEDVVETLLGLEIVDEVDEVEDMQNWARRSWEDRARLRGISLEQSPLLKWLGAAGGGEAARPEEGTDGAGEAPSRSEGEPGDGEGPSADAEEGRGGSSPAS